VADVTERRADLARKTLERLLASALGVERVVVLERGRNPYSSRFSSEIVTLDLAGGPRRVFCKYGLPGGIVDVHGLRSGIGYEATVYSTVVVRSPDPTAACLGFVLDEETGVEMLVLEYLEGFGRIAKYQPRSLPRAAAWVGAFHAEHDGAHDVPGLNRYELDYFLGWATRAREWSAGPDLPSPHLTRLVELYTEAAIALVSGPQTVIHGELYPNNVLIRDARIYPVDWEWAAVSSGEIDLAALTEGRWDVAIVEGCVEAYCAARWPDGTDPGFERRLEAARAYLHMRSLGGRPGRAGTEATTWRWSALARVLDDPMLTTPA
jgi:hypothetical protein